MTHPKAKDMILFESGILVLCEKIYFILCPYLFEKGIELPRQPVNFPVKFLKVTMLFFSLLKAIASNN